MFYRHRERVNRWWFAARCRGILDTPALPTEDSPVRILSMVSHRDLLMYLSAVKSLFTRIGEGRVVVVNDGTLTKEDIRVLEHHLRPVAITDANTLGSPHCPRGGTWERLLLIAEYVADHFVVQVDADTLTLGAIPEVEKSVQENRSFTLGTSMGRQIVPLRAICEQMKKIEGDHVQGVAERNFDRLRGYESLRYIRGCSGFAGFARGSFGRESVEEFSMQMTSILGKKWNDWGSEQVTSNFIIANSPNASVLPYPRFCNFAPNVPYKESAFLHFIGTYRFRNGIYIRKTREVLECLMEGGSI